MVSKLIESILKVWIESLSRMNAGSRCFRIGVAKTITKELATGNFGEKVGI
jgi:hypothetical protein